MVYWVLGPLEKYPRPKAGSNLNEGEIVCGGLVISCRQAVEFFSLLMQRSIGLLGTSMSSSILIWTLRFRLVGITGTMSRLSHVSNVLSESQPRLGRSTLASAPQGSVNGVAPLKSEDWCGPISAATGTPGRHKQLEKRPFVIAHHTANQKSPPFESDFNQKLRFWGILFVDRS